MTIKNNEQTISYKLNEEAEKIAMSIFELEVDAQAKLDALKQEFQKQADEVHEQFIKDSKAKWTQLYKLTGADEKLESRFDFMHKKDTGMAFLVQRHPENTVTNEAPTSVN